MIKKVNAELLIDVEGLSQTEVNSIKIGIVLHRELKSFNDLPEAVKVALEKQLRGLRLIQDAPKPQETRPPEPMKIEQESAKIEQVQIKKKK